MLNNKNQKASALITSIMILGISLTVALSVAVVSIRERKASIDSSKSNNAYQTADQGIEAVMYDLLKSGKGTTDQLIGCSVSDGLIKRGNYAVQLLNKEEDFIDCNDAISLTLVKKLRSTGLSASVIQRAERAVEVPVNNSCNDETVKNTDEFTELLLHFDGGSDGVSFVDSSENDHEIDSHGSAAVSADEFKFCKSAYFPGTAGSYLSISPSSDFVFEDGDYTIDFWMYSEDSWSRGYIFNWCDFSPFQLFLYDDGHLWTSVNYSDNGFGYSTPEGVFNFGQWNHIALVRNGSTFKMYVNGVAEITGTDPVNHACSVNFSISVSSSSTYFKGYMDELRISKGVARWTDDFVPPTAPY